MTTTPMTNTSRAYFKRFGWDDLYVRYNEAAGNMARTIVIVKRLTDKAGLEDWEARQLAVEQKTLGALKGRVEVCTELMEAALSKE